MPSGNYLIQAIKGDLAISNPIDLSIIPEVTIATVSCSDGMLTITGTGFGDSQPAGAEAYINAKVGGMMADIISWTDTEIVADVPFCSDVVTVNALFGSSATSDCEANFDGDIDVDGTDLLVFKNNFGRMEYDTPCQDDNLCNGDFDCDQDVDGTDMLKMKEDFGRTEYDNPCAQVEVGQWCTYE
jgi:hypothetical protein